MFHLHKPVELKLSSISDVLGMGTAAKLGKGLTGHPETLRRGGGRPSWHGPADHPVLQLALPRGRGLRDSSREAAVPAAGAAARGPGTHTRTVQP